jgi:type I restriction enzyme R subunit
VPYARRPRLDDLKALADEIHAPPRAWTEDMIWRAYEVLDQAKVKQRSAERLTTDLVSLVRYAIHREDRLVPFADRVEERFKNWLAQQETAGARFTVEQMEWLHAIKDHVAASYGIEKDDFDYDPFVRKGGLWKVHELFGERLEPMLVELNEALVA